MQQYVERIKACQPDIRNMVDSIIDGILPWRCVVCGLSCTGSGICMTCKAALPWNDKACSSCALPLPSVDDLHCGACLKKPPILDAVFCPLLFKFPVDRLVHKFKFQRQLASGAVLGRILIERLQLEQRSRPDLLLAVPMHRIRFVQRGFNQSFELARQIGKAMNVPVAVCDLQRHRHTPAQSGLDARSRRKNLKGAFRWRGKPLPGMNIALVDDVMTTGSTLNECAKVLKHAGAQKVSAWAVARAVN
ncbi:MAG: ComF family protein [Lysobacterales bacterium]